MRVLSSRAAKMALVLALLLTTTGAVAQSTAEGPQPTTTVVVPVVGNVTGANSVHWRTDLELRNDQRTEISVVLTMPAAPDANFVILPMDPGATLRLSDVASALGVENGLSPLVVQTNSKRSVSIRATAWGTRDTEVFAPQPIGINYGPSYYPVRVLRDLSFSADYRTNIGLANLGDKTAEFTLALQRVAGRNMAVAHLSIPPNGLWHMSIQSAFPLITDGDHFSVVIETSAPQTYVYASVIQNATNSARFVQPTFGTPAADAQ